jgi:4-hydroxy-3-polyprenylbenzoate decarboxylase
VAAGEPVEENHTCWGLAVSAQILRQLRRQGFPVTMCFCPFESAAHWLIVTVKRGPEHSIPRAELARSLGEAIFRSRAGTFIPQVLLLEDDIDPTNLDEVTWAFATRCHPARDLLLFPEEEVLPLVAWLSPEERRAARTTKAVWNGLGAPDLPGQRKPIRSSFRHLWPREIQERVVRNWTRYGYAKE